MLPLELLGEICSHLAPVDLLSLQLVNKHFYRLITANAFQTVWATARRRLGLPDVGGVSEAQYATFVFGKACQSCGVKKLSLVRHDYHLRRILCKACRHQRIVKVSRLHKDHPELYAKLHPLTLRAVNRTAYDTRSTTKSRWLDGDEQKYVDIQDLYRTDASLRDLDDQDLDSDIAAGRDEERDTSTPSNREGRATEQTPGSRVARNSGTRVDKVSGPARRSRRANKLIQLRERGVLRCSKTRTNSSRLMAWSTMLSTRAAGIGSLSTAFSAQSKRKNGVLITTLAAATGYRLGWRRKTQPSRSA